jgi:hypothetical protein
MAKQKPPSEEKPWSTMDLVDLQHAIEQGESVELTAAVLGRSVEDVQRKAKELNPIKIATADTTRTVAQRLAGAP